MGFAGQVFAARVAIGLAVPSKEALQQSAGLIFSGIEAMYQRLGMIKHREAMKSQGMLESNLSGLREITASSTKLMNDTLTEGVLASVRNLEKTTGGSMSAMFDKAGEGTQAFAGAGAALGEMGKIFDTSGLTSGYDKLMKISRGYMSLLANERKMVRETTESILAGSQRTLAAYQSELQGLVATKDANGVLSSTNEARRTALLNELIPAIEEKIGVEKQDVALLHELDRITDKVVDGIEETSSSMKEGTDVMREGAHAIKQGFNEALRNSIALLAAFGYKLNQHTQDLIVFERQMLNANSVFNLTNDQLFEVGNEVVKFGNEYGIAMENASAGLYQFASAGLTAAEAAVILPHTLKLAMAVQGDHNTLAKLTTQVIKGYGMEVSEAAKLTDMFAYTIQKSLVEWQDLASAVKFAMPFFTSTGQSVEQLLGALQILTDRALEAGIAGRGLRQALAEFAESAMDAEVGFRKMGVEIVNEQGEMLQLTEIASQFAAAVGVDITNTELLTTLIEDLNVRGATAFIHLVQASDEFTAAVENTANAGGQLDEMVRIQNESLQAQIQILHNSIFSIFAYRDATFEGTEYLNGFHKALVETVKELQGLFVVIENGVVKGLTPFGQELQNVATDGVVMIKDLLVELVKIIKEFTKEGFFSVRMLRLMVLPLQVMLEVLNFIGPDMLKLIIYMKLMNSVLPMATFQWIALGSAATKTGTAFTLAGTAGKRALFMLGGVGAFIGGALLLKEVVDRTNWMDRYGLAGGGYMHARQGGGGMYGNTPYLVGEYGPELITPGAGGGKVYNYSQTKGMLGSGRTVMKDVTIGIDSFGGLV